MPLNLPLPIASYFTTDRRGGSGIAGLFAANATVKDEGNSYTGTAAIDHWARTSSTKYDYTSRPVSCEAIDGATVVTCHVTGNFPGSPVDLRYFFELDGDKISYLRITA